MMLELAREKLAKIEEQIIKEQSRIASAILNHEKDGRLDENYWHHLHHLIKTREAYITTITAIEEVLSALAQ